MTLKYLILYCKGVISALVSGSNGPYCVVSSGKTIYSHSASLHPGIQMGTGELNAGGNPAMD